MAIQNYSSKFSFLSCHVGLGVAMLVAPAMAMDPEGGDSENSHSTTVRALETQDNSASRSVSLAPAAGAESADSLQHSLQSISAPYFPLLTLGRVIYELMVGEIEEDGLIYRPDNIGAFSTWMRGESLDIDGVGERNISALDSHMFLPLLPESIEVVDSNELKLTYRFYPQSIGRPGDLRGYALTVLRTLKEGETLDDLHLQDIFVSLSNAYKKRYISLPMALTSQAEATLMVEQDRNSAYFSDIRRLANAHELTYGKIVEILSDEKEIHPLELLHAHFHLGVMYSQGLGVERDPSEAARQYRIAAEQGHTDAQIALASMCYIGEGVEKDSAEATQWFEAAAEHGNARAQYVMGAFHLDGEGVEQSTPEAVRWLTESAERGNAESQCMLATMYKDGIGVEQNSAKAFRFFDSAADQRNANAQYNLGLMYRKGTGVKKDLTRAAHYFKLAADQGHSEALFSLGFMHETGEGVEKNTYMSLRYFLFSAIRGYPWAQYSLGDIYRLGDGVERNDAAAFLWFTLAAAQGFSMAEYSLGMMYLFGEGVEKNAQEAVHWLTQAADQGHIEAQKTLFSLYRRGEDVEQNMVEAFRWIAAATEHGSPDEQASLAVAYYIEKNFVEAARWFRRAAERGHVESQYNLGTMYLHGQGVVNSRDDATHWFVRADKQGHEDAQNALTIIQREVNAEKGDADAQFELGVVSYVEKEFPKALKFFSDAAQQGHAQAQFNLAVMFQRGEGTAPDLNEALRWFQMAEENEHPSAYGAVSEAQFAIGLQFSKAGSFAKAIEWYQMASERNHFKSQYNIGILYLNGEGVLEDPHEALRWFELAKENGQTDTQKIIATAQANIASQLYEAEEFEAAIGWIKKAANNGNSQSQFNLGTVYNTGQGVHEDPHEALHWFELALESGCPGAREAIAEVQWNIAVECREQENYPEALRWYQMAMKNGDPDTQKAIIEVQYDIAIDFHKSGNYAEAFKWSKKTSKNGHAKSTYNVGIHYLEGEGVPANPLEALKWFEKALELGYPKAQKMVAGVQHNIAIDFDKVGNLRESFKWAKKAAENGHANAIYNVGLFYLKGEGVKEDIYEVERWLSLAKEKGSLDAQKPLSIAQYNIAVNFHESGNYPEALSWSKKASKNGYAEATYDVGIYYLEGQGVPENPVKALKWFEWAQKLGVSDAQEMIAAAQYNIAVNFHESRNYPEALSWSKKASKNGDAEATYDVGMYYVNGKEGISKDPVEALKWFERALELGFSEAEKMVGKVQNSIALNFHKSGNYRESLKWSKEASKHGHAAATYNAGVQYLEGEGVPANPLEALKWFERAVDLGKSGAEEMVAEAQSRI